MILANGMVMDKDFKLRCLDVEIKDEKIVRIGENLEGDDIIDVKGSFVLPGFIDTHLHGAYGTRVSDPDPDLYKITEFEATQGVTSIALTTASSDYNSLLKQIEVVVEQSKKNVGAKLAAIHAEGPFLNTKYKGAMNEKNILTPDIEKLKTMIEKSEGLLRLITVAPETENALSFIECAVSNGIAVSMGHTNATYDEAINAIKAGVTQATHTFNAMRPLNHREPGVLGAVLTSDDVTCEMICDYVHLHPATVNLIYKIKGADRINMVSDSGHAAGLDIKEFEVDGIKRYVKDGVIRLADGTIAGSAKTLLDGVKNLVEFGIPLEDVSKMASYNPARTLKMNDITGSIDVGKYADIVVLDNDYNVEYTFVNGVCEYKK